MQTARVSRWFISGIRRHPEESGSSVGIRQLPPQCGATQIQHRRALPLQSLRPQLATHRFGGLPSHSLSNSPAAGRQKFPILIFSPGGGGTAIAYTTQLEDLASHGYLVAGIEHTFDAPAVVFPDGRIITASDTYWAHRPHDAADPDGVEKVIVETRAADIMFVIGKLADLQNDRASPFRSRLDLNRIGVFGHSRGGRAAARVCQLDKRVKACLNQDGNMAWQPFWLDSSGRSMDQPFMMLDHLDAELPE